MPVSLQAARRAVGVEVGAHAERVSTSAEPLDDDTPLLPCLATGTPAPAATKLAAVEMLNEPEWSPPVPHRSMGSRSPVSTGTAYSPHHAREAG